MPVIWYIWCIHTFMHITFIHIWTWKVYYDMKSVYSLSQFDSPIIFPPFQVNELLVRETFSCLRCQSFVSIMVPSNSLSHFITVYLHLLDALLYWIYWHSPLILLPLLILFYKQLVLSWVTDWIDNFWGLLVSLALASIYVLRPCQS